MATSRYGAFGIRTTTLPHVGAALLEEAENVFNLLCSSNTETGRIGLIDPLP